MLRTLFGHIRISASSGILLVAIVLLALMGGSALGAPATLNSVFAPAAPPPTLVSYQGFVKVSGSPFSGTGYFKFAVMDAASGDGTTNYWANDGTASGQPSASVVLAVTGGLFDVMLGDTGMTPITQSAFNQTTTYLRVWFSQTGVGSFQALDPNQRIGSAAYALRATRAESAADADQLGGVAAGSYLQTTSNLTAPNLVGVTPLASIPPIPWANLTSVPATFADNVDNDTTYVAGSNLTLTGNTFALADDVFVNSITASNSVKIGNASVTCASGVAGTVRWVAAGFQICDGITWRTVQLSEAKVVLYQANNAIGITGAAIGGRVGADTLCQGSSNKPTGYSSYRALISVSATDEIRDMPTNYGVPTSYPIRSSSNGSIASNWADLLDGTLITYLGGAGVYVNGPYDWWTGSASDGSLDGANHCGAWTTSGAPGRMGRFDYNNFYWISYGVASCGSFGNLLCIAY